MQGNPFYIDPTMGRSKGQNEFAGLGQVIKESRDQKAAQLKQQQARDAYSQAVQSGDPKELSRFMSQYPELAESAKSSFGFTNEQTEPIVRDTYQRVLADPSNAEQYLADGIDQVGQAGGKPINMAQDLMMMRRDPESALKNIRMGYASMDPKGYAALSAGQGGTEDTANIKDFARYESLQKENPAAAAAFARMVGITVEEDKDIKPTSVMQNYDQWVNMPDGPNKKAFGMAAGFTEKESYQSVKDKAEKIEKAAVEITSSQHLLDAISDFRSNKDYMRSVSGVAGNVAITPRGKDARVAFDNIKNLMTLDNLKLMSGVLTDKDIEILSSAASAIETGMTLSAMDSKLQDIERRVSKKINDKTGGLTVPPSAEITREEYDALPPGAEYQYGGKTYRKK